jgi:hypothetical protein
MKCFGLYQTVFGFGLLEGGFRIDRRMHHNGNCKWMKEFMESLKDIEVE